MNIIQNERSFIMYNIYNMSTYSVSSKHFEKTIKLIIKACKASPEPSTPKLVEKIFKDLPADLKEEVAIAGGKVELRRIIYYMRSKNYVDNNNKTTVKGERRLETVSFDKVLLNKNWDGKWRVLVFDIPEYARKDRQRIRRLIKQIGFVQYQLSVWIHPMDCSQQVKELQNVYGSSSQIILMVVDDILGSKSFEEIYNKQFS